MLTAAQPWYTRWNGTFRFLAYVLCASLIFLGEAIEPQASTVFAPVYEHSLSQDLVSPHLPASLAEAPGLVRLTGQRSTSVRSGFSPVGELWGAVPATLILPAPRIEPFTWNLGSPALRLPAARGLIAFALPPPSSL